jgi:hypothetical protein
MCRLRHVRLVGRLLGVVEAEAGGGGAWIAMFDGLTLLRIR